MNSYTHIKSKNQNFLEQSGLLFCKLFLLLNFTFSVALLTQAQPQKARIINGTSSTQIWPWMVSLAISEDGGALQHFCGGTLIDAKYVLTAAHCVIDQVSTPFNISVIIGRNNLTKSDGQVVAAEGIITHPDFSTETQQNDLALIRLSESAASYQTISVLQPGSVELNNTQQAKILGWGVTDPEFSVRPALLQEADIPIIDKESCAARLGIDFNSDSMLCAGLLSSSAQAVDGVDTCYGDSGGPLMIHDGNNWKLFGISSWGYACASYKYWGVYTDASLYYSWIYSARTVAPFSIVPPSVSGISVVGSKLHCDAGEFGGDPADSIKIRWIDPSSGEILSKKSTHVLRSSDIGRKLICEVEASNNGGSIIVDSEPYSPIYPQKATSSFRTNKNSIIREAKIYCLAKSCSIILSFKRNVQLIKSLVTPVVKCNSLGCMTTSLSKIALPLTSNSWRIPLIGDNKKIKALYLNILVVNKKTSLILDRIS